MRRYGTVKFASLDFGCRELVDCTKRKNLMNVVHRTNTKSNFEKGVFTETYKHFNDSVQKITSQTKMSESYPLILLSSVYEKFPFITLP